MKIFNKYRVYMYLFLFLILLAVMRMPESNNNISDESLVQIEDHMFSIDIHRDANGRVVGIECSSRFVKLCGKAAAHIEELLKHD